MPGCATASPSARIPRRSPRCSPSAARTPSESQATAAAAANDNGPAPEKGADAGKSLQWVCQVCGWIYDEAVGDPDSGIEPGTPFEDIPDDWMCPECLVTKEDFVLLSV